MLLETLYSLLPPNQSEKVMLYILEHVNWDKTFTRTYDVIQKDTGVSQPTIARVFKHLENTGCIKHVGKSVWLLDDLVEGWTYDANDRPDEIYVRNKLTEKEWSKHRSQIRKN